MIRSQSHRSCVPFLNLTGRFSMTFRSSQSWSSWWGFCPFNSVFFGSTSSQQTGFTALASATKLRGGRCDPSRSVTDSWLITCFGCYCMVRTRKKSKSQRWGGWRAHLLLSGNGERPCSRCGRSQPDSVNNRSGNHEGLFSLLLHDRELLTHLYIHLSVYWCDREEK